MGPKMLKEGRRESVRTGDGQREPEMGANIGREGQCGCMSQKGGNRVRWRHEEAFVDGDGAGATSSARNSRQRRDMRRRANDLRFGFWGQGRERQRENDRVAGLEFLVLHLSHGLG